MAGELKNISKLFQNSRTRAILVVTIGLLLVMIITGILKLRHRAPHAPTEISLQNAPSGIQSVPGGFEQPQTAEYAKLQTQQNTQQAKTAQSTGGSAVPTIVSSTAITGGWQGGNFSSLNQPQQTLPPNYLLRGGGLADAEGIPVYNQQGLMTGLAYGKGGDRVCVMDCSALGIMGPDGLIRDAKGNIIGKAASSALGTPVYDAQGRLIGYAGADGKVRDLKGNVIGSIGPDGVFKNNAGKPGGAVLGVPVYDAQGRLVGYAGPDGKVRGLNGNVMGSVGTDGVARDASGKIIGKATPPQAPGSASGTTPVYDSQGRLIGYAGPDGTVRDPSGKVIGNLGADGTLRDANGNVMGRAGGRPTGGSGGQTTGPSGASAIPPTENDQLEAARQRQAAQLEQQRLQQKEQLDAQKLQQDQQQLSSAMTAQQNLLFAAWSASPTQQYVEGTKDEKGEGEGAGGGRGALMVGGPGGRGPSGGRGDAGDCKSFITAGTILFAVLNTAVNSDEPGPVMATIVGTHFKGGKLLGSLVVQGDKVMLTFNVMTLSDKGKSIPINAVAIDPCTARTALSSDTDHHYLLRYGSLFAASFMQGYGQAIQQSGAVVVSNGLNTVTNMPTLSPKGQALAALGTVGQAWGQATRPLFNTPPTVRVYSCTGLGILFLQDVATPPCLNVRG